MNLVFVESSNRAWGSEQHFVNLAKGCVLAGSKVVAVVREKTTVATLLREAGVEVRETPFRGGADPRAMRVVVQTIQDINADWVITDHQKHYWPLLLIAKLTGTRLAVFRHLAYVRGWLTRVVFPRLVDRFFVVSQFTLETLAATGAPRARLTCLHNPIDLTRFRPDAAKRAEIRAQLGLPADAFLVGFVGRHEAGKGVVHLCYALNIAMASHPSVHALWIGGGPELALSHQVIEQSQHAARHQWIHWTDRPEDYYVAMDCLVAPSIVIETFGRVVAEAQACGVPVIATQVGGLAEAFEAGITGIALTDIEPSHIAAQIEAVRATDEGNQWRVAQGKRFVKRFAIDRIAQIFLSDLADQVPTSTVVPADSPPAAVVLSSKAVKRA